MDSVDTQTEQKPRPGAASDPAMSRPGESSRRSPWSILREYPHYRNIFAASFVSNVGGWMEMVAIQWAMAQATLASSWVSAGKPSAPVMMGYLAIAQTGPMLALGLVGGIVADRVDRRNLLIVTQALMMLVAGALAVEAFIGAIDPIVLIVLGFINGLVSAFNFPAWGVLTPRLVPRAQLADAIALNGLQFNLSRVVGPAVAGALLAPLGPGWLFVVNALSFLGVILAVARTPKAPPPPPDGSKPWQQIGEALRFSFREPGPRALVLAIFVFSLLATPLLRMLPVIVSEVYPNPDVPGLSSEALRDLKSTDFGLLLAFMGAGAVLGALTIRRVPPWYPRHHLIPLSVLMGGITVALTSMAPSLWWAAGPMVACGLFWMWTFNSSFAALQLLVEDRMRGRVMAISNVISFGAMPVGAIMCAVIGELASGRRGDGFGTQVGMVTLGVILAAGGIVMLIWRTPEVDGMPRSGRGRRGVHGELIEGVLASAHRPPHERA